MEGWVLSLTKKLEVGKNLINKQEMGRLFCNLGFETTVAHHGKDMLKNYIIIIIKEVRP